MMHEKVHSHAGLTGCDLKFYLMLTHIVRLFLLYCLEPFTHRRAKFFFFIKSVTFRAGMANSINQGLMRIFIWYNSLPHGRMSVKRYNKIENCNQLVAFLSLLCMKEQWRWKSALIHDCMPFEWFFVLRKAFVRFSAFPFIIYLCLNWCF